MPSQTEDKLVLYTLERKIIKKNSASRKIGKQSYFFIRYLNFIVFSRALKKNFDCPTLVGRRSFFFKNNFVSLGLPGLQTLSLVNLNKNYKKYPKMLDKTPNGW